MLQSVLFVSIIAWYISVAKGVPTSLYRDKNKYSRNDSLPGREGKYHGDFELDVIAHSRTCEFTFSTQYDDDTCFLIVYYKNATYWDKCSSVGGCVDCGNFQVKNVHHGNFYKVIYYSAYYKEIKEKNCTPGPFNSQYNIYGHTKSISLQIFFNIRDPFDLNLEFRSLKMINPIKLKINGYTSGTIWKTDNIFSFDTFYNVTIYSNIFDQIRRNTSFNTTKPGNLSITFIERRRGYFLLSIDVQLMRWEDFKCIFTLPRDLNYKCYPSCINECRFVRITYDRIINTTVTLESPIIASPIEFVIPEAEPVISIEYEDLRPTTGEIILTESANQLLRCAVRFEANYTLLNSMCDNNPCYVDCSAMKIQLVSLKPNETFNLTVSDTTGLKIASKQFKTRYYDASISCQFYKTNEMLIKTEIFDKNVDFILCYLSLLSGDRVNISKDGKNCKSFTIPITFYNSFNVEAKLIAYDIKRNFSCEPVRLKINSTIIILKSESVTFEVSINGKDCNEFIFELMDNTSTLLRKKYPKCENKTFDINQLTARTAYIIIIKNSFSPEPVKLNIQTKPVIRKFFISMISTSSAYIDNSITSQYMYLEDYCNYEVTLVNVGTVFMYSNRCVRLTLSNLTAGSSYQIKINNVASDGKDHNLKFSTLPKSDCLSFKHVYFDNELTFYNPENCSANYEIGYQLRIQSYEGINIGTKINYITDTVEINTTKTTHKLKPAKYEIKICVTIITLNCGLENAKLYDCSSCKEREIELLDFQNQLDIFNVISFHSFLSIEYIYKAIVNISDPVCYVCLHPSLVYSNEEVYFRETNSSKISSNCRQYSGYFLKYSCNTINHNEVSLAQIHKSNQTKNMFMQSTEVMIYICNDIRCFLSVRKGTQYQRNPQIIIYISIIGLIIWLCSVIHIIWHIIKSNLLTLKFYHPKVKCGIVMPVDKLKKRDNKMNSKTSALINKYISKLHEESLKLKIVSKDIKNVKVYSKSKYCSAFKVSLYHEDKNSKEVNNKIKDDTENDIFMHATQAQKEFLIGFKSRLLELNDTSV